MERRQRDVLAWLDRGHRAHAGGLATTSVKGVRRVYSRQCSSIQGTGNT